MNAIQFREIMKKTYLLKIAYVLPLRSRASFFGGCVQLKEESY